MPKQRYIRVGTQRISVSEEVYLAIMRPIWTAERQERRNKFAGYTEVSLDERFERLGAEYPSGDPSVEEIVELMDMRERLSKALLELTKMERSLIDELYFRGKSGTQLSKETGVSRTTIASKEKNILAKLRTLITGK
jgi:RNA polymerase sigma factor (sigma-70 family)